MSFIRSILHMAWMVLTVVPYTLAIVLGALFGMGRSRRYRIASAWLGLSSLGSARALLGIQTRITGMENLPVGEKSPAVLLVKHQSTFETFLMPAIMPHPLAYVFKRELLYIPFFGWAMARMDMIHIDRSKRSEAWAKVAEQGKRLMAQGNWVIMFPEGTRAPRGGKGDYKSGGTRLAIAAGVPVVPIAVSSAKCWPRKSFLLKPGVIDVSIGKPIASVGRRPDELMREVEHWIETEMRRLDPDAYLKNDRVDAA